LTPRDDLRDDGKPAGWGKLEPKSITESGVEGIASRHGYRVEELPLSLYDLSSDRSEQKNVAAAHPDVVAKLTRAAQAYRAELGDSLADTVGSGLRPIGRVSQ
jgi:arylsulfatase